MKVLLVNRDSHKEGCTYTALCEVTRLNEEVACNAEVMPLEQETPVFTNFVR